MPERGSDAINQATALTAFEAGLADCWHGLARIPGPKLAQQFPTKKFVAGWEIPLAISGTPVPLVVVCDRAFPYSLPRFAIEARHALAIPHVESDGVLCAVGPGTGAQLPVNHLHAVQLLPDARELVNDGFAGTNQADFIAEFNSYWTLNGGSQKTILSLLQPSGVARTVIVVPTEGELIIAESLEAAKTWHGRVYSSSNLGGTSKGAFVPFATALMPQDYPSSGAEALKLLQSQCPTAMPLVRELTRPGKSLLVVLGFNSPRGYIFAGLMLEPMSASTSGPGKVRPDYPGFRPARMSNKRLLEQATRQNLRATRALVTRVDQERLIARTTGAVVDPVGKATVAIVGCGAVGSAVALHLAQSGVRRLLLVDGQLLTWDNVGRHVLLGANVGSLKAKALGQNILARFPGFDVRWVPKRWQDEWEERPRFLNKCDLVISTTADWASEALLNDLARGGDVPATIFGWVEPYAIAGHALAVLNDGGCLRCACDKYGGPLKRVAAFDFAKIVSRDAGCAGTFQTYSGTNAAPTCTMIARLALDVLSGRTVMSEHRVWVASRDDFDCQNVGVAPPWDALGGELYERVHRAPIIRSASCAQCNSSL